MKKFLLVTASALALSTGAHGADVYSQGSIKDSGFAEPVSHSRSGIYLTGALGWASIERDASASIKNQKNELGTVCASEDDDCGDVGDFNQADELVAGQVAGPLVFSDALSGRASDDQSAMVFGGELSYLFHLPNQRFALELGLGGTFYTDNESSVSFAGIPTITGTAAGGPVFGYPDIGEAHDENATAGHVSFERDYDIDLVAKGHVFVTNNLSLYAGAGLSWAQASMNGSYGSTYATAYGLPAAEGVFDNSFSDDDSSLGYVLMAGFQWWATDRIVIGGEYSYKAHEFDFSAGKTTDAIVSREAYRYNTNGTVEVDEDVHAFKLRAGLKLN